MPDEFKGGAQSADPPLHIAVRGGGSDHHMSDCDTPTAADHEMEQETEGFSNGVPQGWSIGDVPTDSYMAIDGEYTLWLVIDTNILIEDLDHLKEFHRGVTLAGPNGPFKDIHFNILYYIPKKVNSELCAQKERGLKQHKAREANRVLYDVLSRDKHGVQESDKIQREAEEAFPDVLRGPDVNNDDHIRLSAMYLQDQKSKAEGKHAVVLLTGDVNLAIKARASGLTCRKLAGSAGSTMKNLPTTRPQLLKEFFPEVIVKTDKERRIEALKEKAAHDPNLRLLSMHGLGSRRRSQPRSNSGGLSPLASASAAGKVTPHADSPTSSRSSYAETFHRETSGLSDDIVQRQSSLGRVSQASPVPDPGSQPRPPSQGATPDPPPQAAQGALLPRGHDVLDCLMSGLRLALQWHLQHRYPNVWEQEMGYMTSAARLLERLVGWLHVLDLFTTIQAEDERQIMQALQQLKRFSDDPEQGDLWQAVECGRMVLSSFSRPLSTVALSVSQPVDAEEAFAALKEARKRMNKLYSQLAKDRPRVDPSKASSAGYGNPRPAPNPRSSGEGVRPGQQQHVGADHGATRSVGQQAGNANGADMQSPFLHQQHLQFAGVPGLVGHPEAALLQGLGGLELSGRSASGHSLQSQLSGRSVSRTGSFGRSDSAQPPDPARGHYSTRAGYQQPPMRMPSMGVADMDAAVLLHQQAALMQAGLQQQQQQQQQQPQLSPHGAGPGFAASLAQQALAQAEWNAAAMQSAAVSGMGSPAGSAHMQASSSSSAMQQHVLATQAVGAPAGAHNGGGMIGMQAGLQAGMQEHPPSSPQCRAPGFKTAALMQAAVELLAAAQQWGPGEDMAARRLLQALVLARRAAASFPADMQDQSKLHNCLQALQALWSLLLQSCRQDALEPDFEDMLMYLSDVGRLEGVAKQLLEMTNKG